MSLAIAGVGTAFERWSGSAWVAISEIMSISGPSKSRETIDVTSLDSTGGYREFIGSFRDGGSVELGMNFIRGNYDTLNDDFESNTVQQYRIVLPDSGETCLEFNGLVTEMPLEVAVGDKVSNNATLKVTGQVTMYDNSSGA